MLVSSFCAACRLRLDQVCRAWNAELHTGAAAVAAWQTLSLSKHLGDRIGIMGEAGWMAAWAIRHRDFVKELFIEHGFQDEWVSVSMLVHKVCQPCPLVLHGQPQHIDRSIVFC